MGLDDPVVIVLIVAVVVFLFGAGRIPAFAKSLGTARREFDKAMKGNFESVENVKTQAAPKEDTTTDPLMEAAKREGIDTKGKTKREIASALSWKLNKRPE